MEQCIFMTKIMSFKVFSCLNLSVMFKNNFLLNETKVFTVS
jgi:hypothetical protein